MIRPWTTTILGAGPVGLIASLAAARRGPTTLVVKHWPPKLYKPRIDVLPAPFLTLMLELGIDPKQLGIESLHDTQLAAWDSARPAMRRRPASAHVERARLELALAAAVDRNSRITIKIGIDERPSLAGDLVIDATGRAAVSARQLQAPLQPWHAQSFGAAWSTSKAVQGFRIAALPAGYAYRVGDARYLMVGVILCGAHFDPEKTEDYLRIHGAGWLLSGLPALASMRRGRGGVCSIQWSEGDQSPVRVGDASLARDSLASQGISIGGADALQLASRAITLSAWAERMADQRRRHIAALCATINQCRFNDRSVWAEYANFLANHSETATASTATGPVGSGVPKELEGYQKTPSSSSQHFL
jgi:hypothetical protein